MSQLLMARDIGPYFLEKREAAGLTQIEVARKLGYTSSQFVSNWERGLSKPPFKALAALIEMYGLDKNEVMGFCMISIEGELRRRLTLRKSAKSSSQLLKIAA